MTGKLLIDTHVLLWLLFKNKKLGRKTTRLLEIALVHDAVYASAITWWECALLQRKHKLKITMPVDWIHRDALEVGINSVAVSDETAMLAAQLEGLHNDPADRLICAAALLQNATLVTADSLILDWQNHLKRWDASL